MPLQPGVSPPLATSLRLAWKLMEAPGALDNESSREVADWVSGWIWWGKSGGKSHAAPSYGCGGINYISHPGPKMVRLLFSSSALALFWTTGHNKGWGELPRVGTLLDDRP